MPEIPDPIAERIVRDMAVRILLVTEVGNGLRCPRCHGQPSARRWPSGRVQTYLCGCGHRWNPRSAHHVQYQLGVLHVLALLAKGEPLPPVPPKIRCEPCETGERHA